jgi:hypothetical protein
MRTRICDPPVNSLSFAIARQFNVEDSIAPV